MSARTYYRRTADEQNAVKRESWKKAIHYSSDSSQLSHSSFPLQLFFDISLWSSSFLNRFSFFDLSCVAALCLFSTFISLYLHFSRYKALFKSLQPCQDTHSHAHTHTHTPVSQGPLGYLVCSHDTDVPQPPKQQISQSRLTVQPGHVRTFH